RSLPSRGVTAALDGHVLKITGTDGDDSIRVTQQRFTRMEVSDHNGPVWNGQADQVRKIEVRGGKGDDTITLSLPEDGVKIPAEVRGGAGNDTIKGGAGNDHVSGGGGNDQISGGGGHDRIHRGAGNDSLKGGAGDDRITGGA